MLEKHKKSTKRITTTKMRAYQLIPSSASDKSILHKRAIQLAIKKAENAEEHQTVSYVKFRLGLNEWYGVPFDRVKEVLRNVTITKIPFMPTFVEGVINHRGFLLPIINLKKYFNLSAEEGKPSECEIVIIEGLHFTMGLYVDSVKGTDSYQTNKLDHALSSSKSIKDEYVVGLHNGKTVILKAEAILQDAAKQLTRNS